MCSSCNLLASTYSTLLLLIRTGLPTAVQHPSLPLDTGWHPGGGCCCCCCSSGYYACGQHAQPVLQHRPRLLLPQATPQNSRAHRAESPLRSASLLLSLLSESPNTRKRSGGQTQHQLLPRICLCAPPPKVPTA